MELLMDYDYEILCHPGKENIVAYTLWRKVNPEWKRSRSFKIEVILTTVENINETQNRASAEKYKNEERLGKTLVFEENK